MSEKYVYFFGNGQAEGAGNQKELLGGKGANLHEMTRMKLPVPPGFTLSTAVCGVYYRNKGDYPQGLADQVKANLEKVEALQGAKFGDVSAPLLVSVRSGAPASMPGMMDTILNLGLNKSTVEGLARQTGNPRFAYDSFRRFIQMYGEVVLNIAPHGFESLLLAAKNQRSVANVSDLSAADLQVLVTQFLDLVAKETGKPFPSDPQEQLWGAIAAVFNSWMAPRAVSYRKIHKLPADWGTAVNVQAMVFGNMGDDCATGVAFTRDPSTGEKKFFGEFLSNAQGEDVVAGIRTPHPINVGSSLDPRLPTMEKLFPESYAELVTLYQQLEKHYRDMQDIEFTVQKGKLYLLQTRNAKRTASAAIRAAVEMVDEGLIKEEEAILRVTPTQVEQLLHPRLDPRAPREVIARGLPASPGAACGEVVFSSDDADKLRNQQKAVILVRHETSPEDIVGMDASVGVLTALGGMTSHAAVVARGMGKPCVAGCGAISINYGAQEFTVGALKVKRGEFITIDGATGEVMLGKVATINSQLDKYFTRFMGWVDSRRTLGVRANADTPNDAKVARQFGAEGVGLCRTEHMFFEATRIQVVREMILAANQEERGRALDRIFPMQKEDFIGIFREMAGCPVTIRLLDPPLHEFLPKNEEEIRSTAMSMGISADTIRNKVKALHEFNPMLGHRGCRLGITYPEIYEMQTRAIMEAAAQMHFDSHRDLEPEILIPFVSSLEELTLLRDRIDKICRETCERNHVQIKYSIGTMIEIPRAALLAEDLAKHVSFFSFGTNDLTQMTLGLSRDDAGTFLPTYLEKGIYKEDPFVTLDQQGVGELMRIASERGRKGLADIKLGICGEHGGDAASVEFCHRLGFNYVSCSPFRVPVARLAAAQATFSFLKENCMRLKRLELQGFKSFLDRTILNFEPGITGVVGPNGCGKSNIVDAILWVMGEQSPKHLRGDTMTDVIFAGSDHKAATSFAEVSLVLDRESAALAPNFSAFDKGDEISITRRLYRDGHGEFLINRTACRLKDIHELFMDTGVGRRAYSIIEQGQIDRMINVKPEERRHLFEEVAGITKYKAKRKEAERKLDQTRQNLLRLQDIVTELEKQIRSLKIQATRARKFKELKVELETADLFLLGRDLYEHSLKQEGLRTRVGELQSGRAQADAVFAQSDAQATEWEIERIDLEKKLQALAERERDLSLLVQRLQSDAELLEERRKNLSHSQSESLEEERDLEGQITQGETSQRTLEQERIELGESIAGKFDVEIQDLDIALRQHQDTVSKKQRERSTLLTQRNGLGERRVQLQNQCSFAESRERECHGKQQEINDKLTAAVVDIDARKVRIDEMDKQVTDTAARTQAANDEASRIHSECEGISTELSDLEERTFLEREKFHGERSRLRSLQELQENLEGYSPTAREILLKLGSERAALPFAETFQPDPSIEEHLEALLGTEMNTLVVQTAEEAERLARLIQDQGLERVRVVACEELTAPAPAAASYPGTVSLETLLKVQPGYESVVRWRLGGTFVCDTFDALFTLRQQYPGVTFLARDTRAVAHGDRSLSSGNPPTKVGVFARRREIETLTITAGELEKSLVDLEAKRQVLLARLETQETLQGEWKEKLSSLHIEAVERRKERERLQHELNRADRDYNDLCVDSTRNIEKLEAAASQREEAATELHGVTENETQVVAQLEEAETFLAGSAERYEALSQQAQQLKIERSRLEQKQKSIEEKLETFADQLHEWTRRLGHLQEQRTEDERELAGIGEKIEQCHVQRSENSEELNQVRVRTSDAKTAFNDTCEKLQTLRASLGELQSRRDQVARDLQETEIALAQAESGLERLRGIAEERYQSMPTALDETALIDLEKLPLFAADLDMSWDSLGGRDRERLLQEHVKAVRGKVGRYGEVNLTAIQEFEEVEKRYAFLQEQKADLENSIRILEEAIEKIDFSTVSRFTETFEAVRKKFNEIFPILFNGGKAELIMTNSDNILEAGVDIMVQPPGKRLQSISLLSGGEKALTAVSLVLAIFARKPSPFCLLDEVDAPLDDANVSRFNTVVRKMAEKTQFIVITHNKKTMEIAEALYGVTMERAGISKMASVRLN